MLRRDASSWDHESGRESAKTKSSMSGADRFRRLLTALALISLAVPCANARAGTFSAAEEFLAHDWRQEDRSGLNSPIVESAAGKIPTAVGPLPVPGGFMEAETTRFERIPQIMGPGRESSPAWPLAEGFPGRCYVSSRKGDGTTLLLVWGTNGMAQCIAVFRSRDQLAPSVDCAPSDAVQAGLHTPEGLRLGMTRTEVEALLGPPNGHDAGRLGYARVSRLQATKELLRRLGRRYEPGETTVMRFQQVMVWLRDDRVVGFAVEQHSHYN